MIIRSMNENDSARVLEIYQAGIDTGNATFTEHAGSWEEFHASRLPEPRFIAAKNGTILGWAALTAVSSRCVYEGVAEVSIYVDPVHGGKGVGQKLMQALVKGSEEHNTWLLTASILPENLSSIKLHEKNGFKILGRREKPARQNYGPFKGWRDIIVMERRSQVIGID